MFNLPCQCFSYLLCLSSVRLYAHDLSLKLQMMNITSKANYNTRNYSLSVDYNSVQKYCILLYIPITVHVIT